MTYDFHGTLWGSRTAKEYCLRFEQQRLKENFVDNNSHVDLEFTLSCCRKVRPEDGLQLQL